MTAYLFIAEEEQTFQIFIKDFEGQTNTIDAKGSSTHVDIKALLKEKFDMTDEQITEIRLRTGSHEMADGRTLMDYKIGKSSTIHMCGYLLGGGNHMQFNMEAF